MTRLQKGSIFLLRIIIGWFFIYQGITIITDPNWTLPYIATAHTFPHFYSSLAHSDMLPYIVYIFKGLFLLVGGLLFLGIFVRIASLIGLGLMLFFYFPLLQFPYVENTYYLVDYHIIIAAVLCFLYAIRAGDFFGLGGLFRFSRHK